MFWFNTNKQLSFPMILERNIVPDNAVSEANLTHEAAFKLSAR